MSNAVEGYYGKGRNEVIDEAINAAYGGNRLGNEQQSQAQQAQQAKILQNEAAKREAAAANMNRINESRKSPEQVEYEGYLNQIRRNESLKTNGQKGYDPYLQSDITNRYRGTPYMEGINRAYQPEPVLIQSQGQGQGLVGGGRLGTTSGY